MRVSTIQPIATGTLQQAEQSLFAGKRLITAPQRPQWDMQQAIGVVGGFPQNAPPTSNPAFHKDRREAFLAMLPPNSTVVVTGNRLYGRNYDVDYEFRQDSNFYYLTGFDEADAVAVLSNVTGQPRYTLFVQPHSAWRETWDGERAGVEGAKNTYGANAAYTIDELDQQLPGLLSGAQRLMWAPSEYNEGLNKQTQKILRANNQGPALRNVSESLHQLRTIKTPYEIALMKRACDISVKAHLEAMKRTPALLAQNGGSVNEGQVEALAEYHFRDGGAERVGYPSIVGGASRGCTLHYDTNRKDAKAGDLVLIDAGAEYGYYTADVTRTWPVNGRFTPEQKALYDVVLDAQESSIQMVKPGVTLAEVHANAVRKVTEGLVQLGILHGNVDDLINSGAYFKYFMHGTSHMMGLDVHDVNLTSQQGVTAQAKTDSQAARQDITQRLVNLGVLHGNVEQLTAGGEYFKYFLTGGDALGVPAAEQAAIAQDFAQLSATRGHARIPVEAGMVFSVEPGIYIPKDDPTVDPKWRGIGIRIEDDILVTPTGYENLTGALPRTTQDIERAMA